MPCRDDRDNTHWHDDSELRAEIDTLTRLLCYACQRIDGETHTGVKGGMVIEEDQLLHEWWEDHKKRDKERLKREGLAKLTAEEKQALGF